MNPLAAQPQCLPAELASCQVLVLGKLGYAIKRHAVAALEEADGGFYDFSVLAFLAQGACAAQSAIAEALQLDRSQLVGLLDGLEDRGLVERKRDPADRRRHTVTLTAEGARALDGMRAIVKRVEQEFLAPLSADERKTLFELTRRALAHNDARFDVPAEMKLAS